VNKQTNEIKNWATKLGLYPIEKPEIDVSYIAELANRNLSEIPIKEFESLITKLVAYNIYLKSLKGSLEARRRLLASNYKKMLVATIQHLFSVAEDDSFKFKTKDEKEVLALQTNNELASLDEQLLIAEMKIDRIKDIPYSIDVAINNLKLICGRKIKELEKN
jgi:hypothetical protein